MIYMVTYLQGSVLGLAIPGRGRDIVGMPLNSPDCVVL